MRLYALYHASHNLRIGVNNMVQSIDNLLITGARTATFGEGSNFSPLFDSVTCTGLESRLLDCVIGNPENARCSHSQDVGVSCMAGKC